MSVMKHISNIVCTLIITILDMLDPPTTNGLNILDPPILEDRDKLTLFIQTNVANSYKGKGGGGDAPDTKEKNSLWFHINARHLLTGP